jgi:LacI family transcriptional regulator
MPGARVRLLDVALRAGVSRTTASFVLSGRTDMRISAAAQERVRRAAEELGYRPNIAARSLTTKSTHTIGLISDTIATRQYAGDFIRGINAAALERGYLLVIGETEGDPDAVARVTRGMLDRQVDGLIYGTEFTRHVELPAFDQHPVVLLNCLSAPLLGPAVVPGEYKAGRAAARALLDAGHREGIYLVGERPRHLFAARERLAGIRAELSRAGASLAGTITCRWQVESAYAAVSDFLDRSGTPAAFICLNDRIALGLYQALSEAKLVIPYDVSVVSFDDSDLATWLRPQLTSVALPHYAMGYRAAELLLTHDLDPVVYQIEMPLRERSSVSRPIAP